MVPLTGVAGGKAVRQARRGLRRAASRVITKNNHNLIQSFARGLTGAPMSSDEDDRPRERFRWNQGWAMDRVSRSAASGFRVGAVRVGFCHMIITPQH
jgi:hypothetical protein